MEIHFCVLVDGHLFTALTNGGLWIFPSLDDVSSSIDNSRAPDGSCTTDCSDEFTSNTRNVTPYIVLQIPQVSLLPSKHDLALIMDTTGSLCDELDYLKAKMHSVIESKSVLGYWASSRKLSELHASLRPCYILHDLREKYHNLKEDSKVLLAFDCLRLIDYLYLLACIACLH
jgi:hypothetical protein